MTVHIIGAGLAGLAAAVHLVEAGGADGSAIVLYEAAAQAGGRCRSYFDQQLGCRIDNGNHLLLSANHAARRYLARIGAAETLVGPARPAFPFIDLATGERWVVRPGTGRLPWWIFDPARRVPGTGPRDYLRAARLLTARRSTTVAAALRHDVLYRRLWEPLAVAALNTPCADGAAILLRRIMIESFGRGGRACIPLVPRDGLSESFVDPALAWLGARGVTIRLGARIRQIVFGSGRAEALMVAGARIDLAPGDRVICAAPAAVAAELLPGITVPDRFQAIVNAHFRTAAPVVPADLPPLIGVVGGLVEWVFFRPGIVSVTISAANRFGDDHTDASTAQIWRDVAQIIGTPEAPPPPARIIVEKRATFAATPDQLARRPVAQTAWPNIVLAGDWTDTGLPATIEGAIRSGRRAAELTRQPAGISAPQFGNRLVARDA